MNFVYRCLLSSVMALLLPGLVTGQEEMATSAKEEPSPGTFGLYPVEDSADIAALWQYHPQYRPQEHPQPDSQHPSPDHAEAWPQAPSVLSLLLQTSEDGAEAVVLGEGTELFRLPDSALLSWQGWARGRENRKIGPDQGRDPRLVKSPTLWAHWAGSQDKLWDWILWPTGLAFEVRSTITSLPKTKPMAERQLNFVWSQGIFRYGSAEFGLHRSQFGGGVTRYLRNGDIDFITGIEKDPPFWDGADWWWHIALGGPMLRYEIRSQGGLVPAHLVLDRQAATLAKRLTTGDIVNWFDDGKSHSGNFSHALHFRLAYLRYSLHWDADAYQAPIMRWGLEDLPFGFGHFRMGLWLADDVLFTEIGVDLMPSPLKIPKPALWPTFLTVMPLRLEFLYRDEKQFQFGLTTRFHIDNRIFRQPGGRP